MADNQEISNRDLKTALEYTTGMVESMFGILQTMQGQNFKIEKRIGSLETEVHNLISKSKIADKECSKMASPNSDIQPEINKEVLRNCLQESSLDVKSFVKDEVQEVSNSNQMLHDVTKDNTAQSEKRLMSKIDILMTTQGNSAKKINQLVKKVQGLKATDSDMSEKLSGLIRCSAHGSIKVHQELVTLNAAAEDSRAKLSTELKTQTRSLKNNQNTTKKELSSELSVLKDIVGDQVVTLECVKTNTDQQTEELKIVKAIAESQTVELSSVKDIVENRLPHSVRTLLKEELKGQMQDTKTGAGAQPSGFMTRSDFSSDDDHTRYVKQHIRVGMKIRRWHDELYDDIGKGDVGTVTYVDSEHVQADWSPKFSTGAMMLSKVELIG